MSFTVKNNRIEGAVTQNPVVRQGVLRALNRNGCVSLDDMHGDVPHCVL